MPPHRVQVSLLVAQALAGATLLRSIAYDRWATVAAAVLLILGTMAAQRGRTWGVLLSFMVAVWFPVAFLIGIAPVWFVAVGLAGAWPFLQLWRSFVRADRGAATTLAVVASALGMAGALAWKSLAFPLMLVFPALAPSMYAQNGLAVLGTLGVLVAIAVTRRKLVPDAGAAPVGDLRIQEPVRFADPSDHEAAVAEAEQAEQEQRSATRRR
ncbi:MAG: hypothetical protein JNK04_22420 [Myxococcales bacterium]|nr:hypothetical protein [Myxococcales bacterium]